MPKRLLIQAGSAHEVEKKVMPINTGDFMNIKSDIGEFSVMIDIKNFDGSQPHKNNSTYNRTSPLLEQKASNRPNLRILIEFTPAKDIPGEELIFGNDCEVSIKRNVPTSLISTGLYFFNWFLNPTITSDLYSDKPYLYGLALNSFTKLGLKSLLSLEDFLNGKNEKLPPSLKADIPSNPAKRQKYFCNTEKCKEFVFEKEQTYFLMFDSSFISIGDSKYHVAIPTFRNKTIDIDVHRFSDETLNNFNWTVKQEGANGTCDGEFGLVINFALAVEA